MFLINRGEIEGRLDSNSYHPERIKIIHQLQSRNWKLKPLKLVASFSKNIVSVNPENLPYIGLENIESNTGFYSETSEKESFGTAVKFKENQVLFPKLRPYLNKVYYADFDGLCSTEFHILDSKMVDNRYLAHFLRLSLVVNQTKHLMSGNTLPRLKTADIENLLIPILPTETQAEIISIFETAESSKKQKKAEATALLASIDGYLLQELGITLPPPSEKKTYFLTRSNQVSSGRFDPFYHQDYFQQAEKEIFSAIYPCVKLRDILKQLKTGVTPHQNLNPLDNEGIIFLRNTNLKPYEFDLSDVRFIKNEYKSLLTFSCKNEVIICIAGTVGTSAVNKLNEPIAINQNITSIKINEDLIDSDFLVAYLNSKLAIELTKRVCSVATIFYLNNENLKNILIPLPPPEKQSEIADHISALRTQAKQLQQQAAAELEHAKQHVEHLILGNPNS